jgi:hypothetical protein
MEAICRISMTLIETQLLLDMIGGDPLAKSGFESEEPDVDYRSDEEDEPIAIPATEAKSAAPARGDVVMQFSIFADTLEIWRFRCFISRAEALSPPQPL